MIAFVFNILSQHYAGFDQKWDSSLASKWKSIQAESNKNEVIACQALLDLFDDLHLALIHNQSMTEKGSGAQSAEIVLKENTVNITASDFFDVSALNNIVADNHNELRAARQIIIDIRGNGGGSDHAWQCLIPFCFPSKGSYIVANHEHLLTDFNIDQRIQLLAGHQDNVAIQDQIKALHKLKNGTRRFVVFGPKELRAEISDGQHPDTTVEIKFDQGTASSAEQFLLCVRQSPLVQLNGLRSAGCIDYGNVCWVDIPNSNYQLQYPTSRSLGIAKGERYDQHGIMGNT